MFQTDKIRNKLFFTAAFLIVSALVFSSCEQAPSMRANNAAATPLPTAENTEKLTSIQREIRDMETANFKIVLVFKRKDGGVFDKEDKKYLSAHKGETNRFILTDDEKAFVAGSNYPFSLDNLEALQKRFIVEDHSKPITQVDVETNANANSTADTNVKKP
jgi:hypothetical protein